MGLVTTTHVESIGPDRDTLILAGLAVVGAYIMLGGS